MSEQTRPQSEEKVAPKYEHDCNKCTFLGRTSDDYADLYYCPQDGMPTVIARYGGLGHQYVSGVKFAAVNPWIREAKQMAKVMGLL